MAAVAALGLAVPVVSSPAEAQTTVVVKKKGGKHMHRGHRHVTVIKNDRRRVHSHSHGRTTKVIIKRTTDEQREQNLREMKSPASIALLGACFVLLMLSFVFYDRPLVDDNRVLSYLRGHQVASTNSHSTTW